MEKNFDSFGLQNLLQDAPGNPAIWAKFLAQLTKQLHCDSSFLLVNHLVTSKKNHLLFHFNLSDSLLKRYTTKNDLTDAFNLFLGTHPYQVFLNHDVLEKREIPYKKPYHLGFSIPCNQYFISLNIFRSQPFNTLELQQNLQTLQALIIPFENAIHAEQQQKIRSQLIHHCQTAFDGYLIMDKHLNIVSIDPVYNLIFSSLDCISNHKDQLAINDEALKSALFEKLSSPSDQFELFNPSSNCQIGLLPVKTLKDLYSWECFKDDFILTFTSQHHLNLTLSRLNNVYNLSKSEGLYALHFVNTPCIAEIAVASNRSEDTIRNHIKRIMHKMDVHSQAALMKKLIALVNL